MPLGFRPIKPKRDPFAFVTGVEKSLQLELRDFGAEAHNQLAKYPTSRTAYRRTGTLGRGWFTEGVWTRTRVEQAPPPGKRRGGDLVVKVANKTEYAPTVQGRKQSALFAAYTWPKTTEINKALWGGKYRGRIMKVLQGKG